MARIIKNSPLLEIETTCLRCQAVIIFEPSDIIDDAAVGTWAICPSCNNKITGLDKLMSKSFVSKVNWDE